MPLARVALYREGIEISVASTWDSGDTWVSSLRHIAAEGWCWVLGSGCSSRVGDVPASFPDREHLFGSDEDRWLNPGDSVVVRPGGQVLAGPLHEEHGTLYADIEPGRVADERRTLDVVGHDARNDVFQLVVDRTPRGGQMPRRKMRSRGERGCMLSNGFTSSSCALGGSLTSGVHGSGGSRSAR